MRIVAKPPTCGNVELLAKMPGDVIVNAPWRLPFPVTTFTTSGVVVTRMSIGPPACRWLEFNSTLRICGEPCAGGGV